VGAGLGPDGRSELVLGDAELRPRARVQARELAGADEHRLQIRLRDLRGANEMGRDRHEDLLVLVLLLPGREDLVQDRDALDAQDPGEGCRCRHPCSSPLEQGGLAVVEAERARDLAREERRDVEGIRARAHVAVRPDGAELRVHLQRDVPVRVHRRA
jgi:hypothetical protein